MSLLNIARSITFFSLFIQLLGLTCAVKIDSYTSRKTRRTMFAIIVLLYCLVFQNCAEFFLQSQTDNILPYIIKLRISNFPHPNTP